MVEVQKRKKNRGSDPADIFNTEDNSDDEESKDTRQPGSPFISAANTFDSDNSDDDETSAITEKKLHKRNKTTLDVGYLTGKGSFLPITVLIH